MSNAIMRHPDPATVMSFAAGTLAEPLAAVVAAHVSMCEKCQAELDDMELMGAALMDSVGGDDSRARLPARPEDAQGAAAATAPRPVSADRLPGPIARAYDITFDTIQWKRLGPGVWHHRLALSAGVDGDLRLLKIAPGREMPDHGHGGAELTLVLDGAYGDETGEYRRGDMQDVDEEIEHRPVADRTTGCICLIASEKPARFKSLVGRLLQPWTGM